MFSGGLFWFLMGMLAVLVGAGFKSFAEEKGLTLNWWKWHFLSFGIASSALASMLGEP